MPNDTDHKIRVVAEAFMGWRAGEKCFGPRNPNGIRLSWCERHDVVFRYGYDNINEGHEIPPPDLLEPTGAWALLVALWKRRWFLCPKQIHGRDDHYVELTQDFGVPTVAFPSSNWVFNDSYDLTPEQLLDLAYQLATKEQPNGR